MFNRNWADVAIQVFRQVNGEIELHCTTDQLFAYNVDDETLLELENQEIVTLYSNYLIVVEVRKKAG